jgi:hypothetical protein
MLWIGHAVAAPGEMNTSLNQIAIAIREVSADCLSRLWKEEGS